MKTIISLFFTIIFSFMVFGQVGIDTETPQKTLHVNGSLQIVNELNVGGNSVTAGSPGTGGQILISQGANNPAIWGSLKLQSAVLYVKHSNTRYGGSNTQFKYLKFEYIDIQKNTFFTTTDNSQYEVVQDGYYDITLSSSMDFTSNELATTTQTYVQVNGQNVLAANSDNTNLKFVDHVVVGILKLKKGDKLRFNVHSNRPFSLTSSSLSINYLQQ